MRKLVDARQLTGAQLATACFENESKISRMLSGEVFPSFELFERFVRACKQPPEEWVHRWHELADLENFAGAQGKRPKLTVIPAVVGPAEQSAIPHVALGNSPAPEEVPGDVRATDRELAPRNRVIGRRLLVGLSAVALVAAASLGSALLVAGQHPVSAVVQPQTTTIVQPGSTTIITVITVPTTVSAPAAQGSPSGSSALTPTVTAVATVTRTATATATATATRTQGAPAAASTGPAPTQSFNQIRLYHLNSFPVAIRSGPSDAASPVGTMPPSLAAGFVITCQTIGQRVVNGNGASAIWDRVYGTNAYISDLFVRETLYGVLDPRLPYCPSTAAAASVPSSAAPSVSSSATGAAGGASPTP